jgi:hypothetical protein
MAATPEAEAMLKALHGELDALLRTLPGKAVSASKIRSVAKACFDLRVEYKRAVHAIERFVSKAPPHCKLGGIYVIDAVCRRSRAQLGDKDVFSPRFEKQIEATVDAMRGSSADDRAALVRVIVEWNKQKLFPAKADALSSCAVVAETKRDLEKKVAASSSPRPRERSPRPREPEPEPEPEPAPPPPPPPPEGFDPRGAPPGGFDPRGPPPGGFDPRGPPPDGFDPRGRPPFDPRGPPPGNFDPRGPPPGNFDPRGPPPGGFDPRGPPPGGFDPRGPPPGRYDDRPPYDDRRPDLRDRPYDGGRDRPYDGGRDRPYDDDEEFESGRAGRARPAEPPRSGTRPATQAELDNSRKPDGSLRWQKHLKKTRICKFWLERNGDCPYGANCNFAHGEAEIERPRPPSPEFHARNSQYNAAAPPPGAFAGSTPRADGFQRRGGFDRDRFNEPVAASPRVVESSQPPPPPPPPKDDEEDAWSDGSLEAEDDLNLSAKRPRLAA